MRLIGIMRDRRFMLQIDSNGLLDRRQFDLPVPWDDVCAVKGTNYLSQAGIPRVVTAPGKLFRRHRTSCPSVLDGPNLWQQSADQAIRTGDIG